MIFNQFNSVSRIGVIYADMHYIYKITNKINNKVYIGQTNNPARRWSQHRWCAENNKGSQLVTRALAKHGVDNFEFEVIITCQNQNNVNELEVLIIKQFNSVDLALGYNIELGGNNPSHTPETARKISEGLLKRYETQGSKLTGVKHSEERKANLSRACMGKAGTNNGKTFSDEWVTKLSRAQAGKDKKSKRRFNEEAEKEICRLYMEEEKSMYFLAKQFNCQRTLIDDILKRCNVEKRDSIQSTQSNNCNIFTENQEIEICSMYTGLQLSRAEIARRMGCGKTTIRNILIRNNVKL
ncbi:MAG: GIY-YIG nuclease family protein, partial [Nanoarchaeota archaeon]